MISGVPCVMIFGSRTPTTLELHVGSWDIPMKVSGQFFINNAKFGTGKHFVYSLVPQLRLHGVSIATLVCKNQYELLARNCHPLTAGYSYNLKRQ